jgi:hypothetical protein
MSLHLWGDAGDLSRRLEQLGLQGIRGVELHQNRTVMVSVTRRGVLRLHQGYLFASDQVLGAIVRFLQSRGRGARAGRALKELLAFPVERLVTAPRRTPRRGERPRPEDGTLIRELQQRHARLNQERFGGGLQRIRFRISSRMRSRLGEVLLDGGTGRPAEIAISRRHLHRDGWAEVEATLLHEMVHQWQGERGLPVDHGRGFRVKAREVGAEPSAKRDMGDGRRRT